MPATRQRSRSHSRERSRQRQGARSISEASTRPNLLSLVIAMGVIGLVVVMFPLDWIRAPSVTVAADQSTFSPNNDGTQEEVAAFYTLSEQANVSAMVRNSAGLAIRTLVNQQPQPDGQHAVTWDGRDDSGQVVPDGLYQIAVTAAATARNSEHTVPVEVDTTPPRLQLANFADDITTREPNFTVEGTTEPNVTVWVTGDPRPVPVDARGVFQVSRLLDEGLNPLEIRAVDGAGNETMMSRLLTLRTRPPDLQLSEPVENNAFVSSNLVTVKGSVPPDVAVTVNGRPATVDERGTFALDLVLDEGENVLRVVATDPVGNESAVERRITLRSQGPTITVASVPDGLVVRDPSVRVSGRVDPGAALRVNGNTVPIDANGNFSALVALQGGNNLITITATDLAGNASTLQRTVHYTTNNSALSDLPRVTIPEQFNSPLLWRLLIGTGLVGAALFIFGGLASPLAFEVTVDYPTFYPNRPGEQRLLILRLFMSRGATVDIDVYDEFNRHVATLVDSRKQGAGEHFRLWDGRNAAGQVLPSGSYRIQAGARTATNHASSAVWVRLDPSQPRRVKVRAGQAARSMAGRRAGRRHPLTRPSRTTDNGRLYHREHREHRGLSNEYMRSVALRLCAFAPLR